MVLVDRGLSHGRGIHRELGFVQKLLQFPLDAMADSASIDEDGNVAVNRFYQFVNTFDNGSLSLWVVLRWLPVERGFEPCGGDLLVSYIGGKGDIHRPPLCENNTMSVCRSQYRLVGTVTHGYDTVGQHAVNLDVGVLFSDKVGLGMGNLFGSFQVRVVPEYLVRGQLGADCCHEPSIAKGVVQHGLRLELQGVRNTDDVNDRNMLGKC